MLQELPAHPISIDASKLLSHIETAHQSLDQQMDALTTAGVDTARVKTDKLSGTSTRQQRPGLAALLDYARQGDAIAVVGMDRLRRNAGEVMTTIRDLGERFRPHGGRCSRQSGRALVGARDGAPHGSARCTARTRAIHRSPEGID